MKLYTLILALIFTTTLSAQEWEQLNNHPFGVGSNHGLGFSFNGKGYMLTGTDMEAGNPFDSNVFWEYDPVTDDWTQLPDYPGPTRSLSIGNEWNGKYYFGFGSIGFDVFLNDLWVYDPADGSFTELPSCPCVGRNHPAFIAKDDKVFVGMGSNNNGNRNDWWMYDMITEQWTQKTNIPGKRHHPFHFESGENIVVGGGHNSNWYSYDIPADTWTLINSSPGGRVAGAEFSYNGVGYIISGDRTDHTSLPSGEFKKYNAQFDTWESLPDHPGGSRWAPSQFVIGDELYFLSGQASSHDYGMWKFDLSEIVSNDNIQVKKEQFDVFPNPFNDEISIGIDTDKLKVIEIFNLDGKRVYFDNAVNNNRIDLSNLTQGAYLLKVTEKDNVRSQLIIKK